jgi:hypothetical protein
VVLLGGNRLAAIGALVEAWTLAQKWYLKTHLVPLDEWRKYDIPDEVIKAGLARVIDGKVRVSGIDEQFSWLRKASEGGRENKGKSRKGTLSPLKGREALTLTLTPSLTLNSNSDSNNGKETISDEIGMKSISNPVAYFISCYIKAYQNRYGKKARPYISGKVQGQIKELIKTIPIDRLIALINKYLEMTEPWFITKAHDFGTFASNIDKISLSVDTGQAQLSNTTAHNLASYEEFLRRQKNEN